jgi:hypothetical protein
MIDSNYSYYLYFKLNLQTTSMHSVMLFVSVIIRIGGFFVTQSAQRLPIFAVSSMTLDVRIIEVSKMLELSVNSSTVFRYMILMVDRDHNVEIANYKAEIANVTAEAKIEVVKSAL